MYSITPRAGSSGVFRSKSRSFERVSGRARKNSLGQKAMFKEISLGSNWEGENSLGPLQNFIFFFQ
jgi:hypothetical protein